MEAVVTIGGKLLTEAQVMAMRIAISSDIHRSNDKRLSTFDQAYMDRLKEVESILIAEINAILTYRRDCSQKF